MSGTAIANRSDTSGCSTTTVEEPGHYNPPGQPALAYRIGAHATFLRRMASRLAAQTIPDGPNQGARPLAQLTTRAGDDPAIALLDAWAAVADVLTFYQERIANEGYLRTATERRSVLELARAIGYELSPGVAASAYLAFTVEDALGSPGRAIIDAGTKVQSVPGPGEQPQTFETVEKIEAQAAWNAMKPEPTKRQTLGKGCWEAYLKGTSIGLKPGDHLLIVGDECGSDPARSVGWDLRRAQTVSVDAQAGRTRVTWEEELGEYWDSVTAPKVYALRQRAALFGYNAPDWRALPDEMRKEFLMDPVADPKEYSEWPGFELMPPHGLFAEYFRGLDMSVPEIVRTDFMAFFKGFPPGALPEDNFSVRWTGWLKTSEQAGDYSFQVSTPGWARLWVNGQLLIYKWDTTQTISPTIKLEAQQLYELKLEFHSCDTGSTCELSWVPPGAGAEEVVPHYQLVPVKQSYLHLDALYPHILPGSWLVMATPIWTELFQVETVAEDAQANFMLTSKATRVTLSRGNLDRFDYKRRETNIMAQSEELTLAEKPITTPVLGSPIQNVGLEDQTLAPLEGNVIVLDRLVPSLAKGQTLIVSGKRMRVRLLVGKKEQGEDLAPGTLLQAVEPPSTDPQGNLTWHLRIPLRFDGFIETKFDEIELVAAAQDDEDVSEAVVIAKEPTVDDTGSRTVVVLESELGNLYDRATVTIHGNLARATHGETRREVLGSGDSSVEFQKFTLKQTPLTYASSATASGAVSTLQVRVNDLLWGESPGLYGLQPHDRAYITRIGDDGKAVVEFGNGVHGARLPTGADNVVAAYRVGTGLAGTVEAGQLSLLLTRPLGVRGGTNPLPASGAADPENLLEARGSAPFAVRVMDRIVSLSDFADFTRAFAGIGKAQAIALRAGEARLVHITVATSAPTALSDKTGAPLAIATYVVDTGSPLYQNLVAAIRRACGPAQRFEVHSYQPAFFNVTAKVQLDPSYSAEAVLAVVSDALKQAFSFEQRAFGQDVSASEVINTVQGTPGVIAVDLDQFYRYDQQEPQVEWFLKATEVRQARDRAELLLINPAGITLVEMKP